MLMMRISLSLRAEALSCFIKMICEFQKFVVCLLVSRWQAM